MHFLSPNFHLLPLPLKAVQITTESKYRLTLLEVLDVPGGEGDPDLVVLDSGGSSLLEFFVSLGDVTHLCWYWFYGKVK